MQHLMMDIETLGKRTGCVVLSVALARCSDEARAVVNLNIRQQEQRGLHVDQGTVKWWDQFPDVFSHVTKNAIDVVPALIWAAEWIKGATGGEDFLIWSHGASFDLPIMTELYRVFGVDCPWQHWQMRCTRTLYDLAVVNLKKHAIEPKHDPMNDVLAQVRALNESMTILRRAHV